MASSTASHVPSLTGVGVEYWGELGLPDPASDGASLSRKAITRLMQYAHVEVAQECLDSYR